MIFVVETLIASHYNSEQKKSLLSLEKLQEGAKIANAKGASIHRGRYLSCNNPLKESLSDCDSCPIRQMCTQSLQNAKCYFEIQQLKANHQKGYLFIEKNPRKMLEDIQITICKLEEAVHYDENPRKKDLVRLIRLKMRLFTAVYRS